jgi:hypothetical protein
LLTYTHIIVSHSAEKQHFSRNAINLSAILTKHESNVTTAQCVPCQSALSVLRLLYMQATLDYPG